MSQAAQILQRSFNFNLGNFSLPISYLQASLVVFLLFILILTFAQFRRHYVDWSLKGGVIGIFFGFLFALILEGFLIVGGKTALTEILGWKNAPAPIQMALDTGRNKLIEVLGIQTQIPSSLAREPMSVQGAVESLQSLNSGDLKKVKSLICTP